MDSLTLFLSQTINGITLGFVYALIALGFSIVFSILRLINFAHGDFYMVGSFAGLFVVNSLVAASAPPIVVILLSALASVAAGVAVGVLTERLAFRRVYRTSIIATMITSLGISIVLQNIMFLWLGPRPIPFDRVLPAGSIQLAGVLITYKQLFVIGITLVSLLALSLWLNRTRAGLALRAVTQEPVAAALVGINHNQMVVLGFAVSSALAGIAGWLFGTYFGRAFFWMGALPGLKAFTATVIGGMGSVPGAVVGGLLMGLLEVLSGAYISVDYKDAIALGVLFLVLIARPQGIFGKAIFKKV
jgi:branched-chain amino acid transport system permease protein